MKASSMRTPVRRLLVELIAAELGGDVSVARGWPGEAVKVDQIYIAGTAGALDNRVFMARALPTDDQFVITVLCLATVGGRSVDAAEIVAERFANAVLVAAQSKALDEFEVNNSFVIQSSIARWDDASTQQPDGNGAFSSLDVAVHTRTRYSGADAQ